jgi:ABC-type hemin transport system substrate-binding protein
MVAAALRVTETGAALVREAQARIERHEQRFPALFDPAVLDALFKALPLIRAQRDEEET